MSFYPVPSSVASSTAGQGGSAVPGDGALMVAVRLADLVVPVKHPVAVTDRSALAVAGTERIRTGEMVVFCKIVVAAPARVRRDGRIQAQGSPCDHATLGPAEQRLDAAAGHGVIDAIADGVVLRGTVRGKRARLLSTAFMLRAIVLMTLMPDADPGEVFLALAGDLVLVPWVKPWRPASPRSFGQWRSSIGPEPLEQLRGVVLDAARVEHEQRDWRAVKVGGLTAGSADGTLIRVPDTPANRAAFGSTGTSDDSAPFPQLRALPLTDASTRSLLGMPYGPSGGDKAAAEQKLLDRALEECPHLFTMDRVWLFDRNFPGAARIARLTARTHVLIRLKSGIRLTKVSPIYPDGSYLAEISGGGVTVTVRVIEYHVDVQGQDVPEMFSLLTDLRDWRAYPAADLATLYRWRWDGSETALREAKSTINGAGPSTGPMLRSTTPDLVRQELAAWATAVEMTRAIGRDAAHTAVPAKKGRRAGQSVQPREISFTAARRAVINAIRHGTGSYTYLTSALSRARTVIDRNRHRARKSKARPAFTGTARDTTTRTAEAVITVCNTSKLS